MQYPEISFTSQDWKVTARDVAARGVQIRRRAKHFAAICKSTNMAYKVPDLLLDSITDEEIIVLRQALKEAGLHQRADFFWEEQR